METEYSSYRLGLTRKLVHWLREVVKGGSVTARDMSQGLGRLGFAAIALDWERPFLGPLYAWEDRPHEATRDAKGIVELASRPPGRRR